MSEPILKIEDLKLGFKSWSGINEVLHGISLHIRQGERVALVGESGSGKSVTARLVLGMLQELKNTSVSGNILFEGQDINTMPTKTCHAMRGTKMSMIFQDPTSSLNPTYPISVQFTEVLRRKDPAITKQRAREVAIAALMDVHINNPERVYDSYAFQLSGGMNQRVMIAMALINDPTLLLADEPGTALDVTVQAKTLKLMSNLVEKNNTAVLFISHNLGVVREFADRVYVIYKGNLVEQGSTEVLFEDPRHPYTQALMSAVPRITGGGIPDIAETSASFGLPLVAHKGFSEKELLS